MLISHPKPITPTRSVRRESEPSPELFRLYKVFPDKRGPKGQDTLTLILSEGNQVYSTWTNGSRPSTAKFLIWARTRKWNLEHSINLLPTGERKSPSEYRKELEDLGYKDAHETPEQIIKKRFRKLQPTLPPTTKLKDSRALNPDDWVSLRMKDKIKRWTGKDLELETQQKIQAELQERIDKLLEAKKLKDSKLLAKLKKKGF